MLRLKKKVNGKTVDIQNVEVFEKAAEGMAINRTTTSTVFNIPENIMDRAQEYINLYISFYKSLPFPLYAIDSNVKYATIGCFIKKRSQSKPKMWVNNALFICIDEETGTTIQFVNMTWGIVGVDIIKEDNTNLEEYQDECGFGDFIWALAKIIKKQSTSTYYNEFMKEFIEACNSQPLVLKWELGNMLEFGRVPDRQEFKHNQIMDLTNGGQYSLDIYITGLRETKKKQHVWSLFDDEVEPVIKPKYVKQYGFDTYKKELVQDDEKVEPNCDKMKKVEMFGMTSIFNTLCAIRNAAEHEVFEDYSGFIADGSLIFAINNRVFIAKAYRFVEPKEVARGVELYSYDRGIVYFLKSKTIAKGIKKETVYSYSLKDGNLRLCKIVFVNS